MTTTDTLPTDTLPTDIDTERTPLADHYDVVVVGARAAGAATALRLARAGLRVAAIDRSARGSDTLSTHALARAGVMLLDEWGLLDEIVAAGTPAATELRFHYGDDEVAFPLTARGGVDALYSPRRTLLDRVLADAAARAGADVRHRTRVTGVVRDRWGRVTGVDIDDHGAPRTIRAGTVVAADGMRSRIATQVGAPHLRRERAASGVIYAYFHGVPDPHVLENELRVDHASGVIPTNDGETCVWIAMPDHRYGAATADGLEVAFDRAVTAAPGLRRRLAEATRTSRFHGFAGQPGFLRHAWGRGWALVGDSGYFKDPVSAHGITDALIGAELLADALIAVAGGADPDTALASYQRERNALAGPMMAPVAALAGYRWTEANVADHFRAMSSALRHEEEYLERRRRPALVA